MSDESYGWSSGVREAGVPTKDEIEAYKAYWKVHSFPDVDPKVVKDAANPAQNYARYGVLNDPTWPLTPEQQLWACVLEESILDLNYKGTNKHKLKDRQDALDWFHDDRRDVGSFHWVCAVLGLDEGWVHQNLTRPKAA